MFISFLKASDHLTQKIYEPVCRVFGKALCDVDKCRLVFSSGNRMLLSLFSDSWSVKNCLQFSSTLNKALAERRSVQGFLFIAFWNFSCSPIKNSSSREQLTFYYDCLRVHIQFKVESFHLIIKSLIQILRTNKTWPLS